MTKMNSRRIIQEMMKLWDAFTAEDERHRKAVGRLLKKAERLESVAANKAQSKATPR